MLRVGHFEMSPPTQTTLKGGLAKPTSKCLVPADSVYNVVYTMLLIP